VNGESSGEFFAFDVQPNFPEGRAQIMCPGRDCLAALAVMTLLAGSVSAGDLAPPGPPASTPGPEPRTPISDAETPGDGTAFFRITRSGSYYLTGSVFNRLITSSRNGIVIEASDVTVDLNGFTLDGFEPFIVPLSTPPGRRGLSSPTTGILASGDLENVTVRNGVVRDWLQGGVDLSSVEGARVEGVSVDGNGGDGISCGVSAVVTRCVARGNGGNGLALDSGCTASISTADSNTAHGFSTGRTCALSESTARFNGENGFNTGTNCTVADCTARHNAGDGINVFSGSVVTACTASENTGDGIEVSYRCLVRDCDATAGAAAIHATHEGNRIEGNLVGISVRGIDVDSTGNLIIRNSVSEATTAYDIVAGNTVGPILAVQDPITSVNPWANFEY
jgi:hypothetical protein